MQSKFFGSKVNTVLLLILIVLMIFAIRLMLQNKELYLHPFNQNQEQVKIVESVPQISGSKDDLVSFSILPGSKVHGVVSYRGVIGGGYFFEANILINVLDSNKNILKQDNAMTKDDWMQSKPVSFEGSIDFTGLPKGPAYIQIHNDNPSDMRQYDKFILIPIVIE